MPSATANRTGAVVEVPLNPFQRTMLCWNELMPYNAVHVAKLAGDANPEKLRSAAEEVLQATRLTDLSIDRSRIRFRYGTEARPIEFSTHEHKDNARKALNQQVEKELNRAFELVEGFNPFRFFVIPDAGAFYLGLVYFHAIADGEAVIGIFKQIIDRYLHDRRPGLDGSHRLGTKSLWRHLSKNPACWINWMRALPGYFEEMKQLAKTPARLGQRPRTSFKLYDFDAAALPGLIRYAHELKITLNDVFLGALLKAVQPHAKARFKEARRRKLAVAFISNIRRDLNGLSDDTFGMFLGSNHVSHLIPDETQFDDLLKDIHSQTTRIREKRLYALNLFGQTVGLRMLRRLNPEKRMSFYADNYPLWGGITNMDLSWYWNKPPEDFYYFRAASIAPASPLNLVITTVNQRINVGLSANPRVYTTEQVENIMENFLNITPFSSIS